MVQWLWEIIEDDLTSDEKVGALTVVEVVVVVVIAWCSGFGRLSRMTSLPMRRLVGVMLNRNEIVNP